MGGAERERLRSYRLVTAQSVLDSHWLTLSHTHTPSSEVPTSLEEVQTRTPRDSARWLGDEWAEE